MADGRRAPHPKKVTEGHAHLVLIDETGFLLNPPVRRTWAPRGKTPVIGGDGGPREKVSVIGAVGVSPVAGPVGLYFSTRPDGSVTAESVADVLRDVLKHLRGKVVVVWDGGPNHKGPVIREFLTRNRRLRLERSPAYAPDLNPVETAWSWRKSGQLANHVPDGIPERDDEIVGRLAELKFHPTLRRSLWDGSDSPFPTKGVG